MENIHSIRVGYHDWFDKKRFGDLIALLKKHPCGIGQGALFTEFVHTPLPLNELEKRAAVLKIRIEALKKEGFSAGINHLCTIGHHCEDLKNCFNGDYYRMTNIFGKTCEGSFCMRDSRFIRDCVIPSYKALADAAPDFIWIDDDVRYGHMPIGNGCFCDGCIEAFNTKHGFSYTRETLRTELNSGDIALRKLHLRHNSGAIYNLLRITASTVRGVSADIKLGFMTGERYFEGYDFKSYAEALSENGKYSIMWRPGGGAYTDYSVDEFVNKSQQIGRQCENLPPYVDEIYSEIENFPYQLIKKSPFFTALEAAVYMTSGCTGAAFNIIPCESLEPVGTVEPHLKAIDSAMPLYRNLHILLKGLRPVGIHSGWRTDNFAGSTAAEWVNGGGEVDAGFCRELFNFGLPECFGKDGAAVTLMTGALVRLSSDSELKELLSGGVMMNAGALLEIEKRGFSRYAGFRVGCNIATDASEQYTADSINDGFCGSIRNCRQAFNHGSSVALVPADSRARILCRLVDYHGSELAPCSMGLFENELGGRVCAAGYYPYEWISDSLKSAQLVRVFRYISDDSLPSYIEKYARFHNVTWKNSDRICVTLFNPSPDTVEDIPVNVLTDALSAHLYRADGKAEILKAQKENSNGSKTFTVPQSLPWEILILEPTDN